MSGVTAAELTAHLSADAEYQAKRAKAEADLAAKKGRRTGPGAHTEQLEAADARNRKNLPHFPRAAARIGTA
jgi:hypothetical protein